MASEGMRFIVLADNAPVSDAALFENGEEAMQYAQDQAVACNTGMWLFQSAVCIRLSQGEPENVDG